MIARMTLAQAQPDQFKKAVEGVKEAFLPAAREHAGYRGFLLLTDGSQQLVGISFWESEADERASGDGGGYYADRMKAFSSLLASPASTTVCEVAINES